MSWHNTSQSYGIMTKLLHSLVAMVIIAQIIIALVMINFHSPVMRTLYSIHKSLGLTLLLLAVLFIVWRAFNRKPEWPLTMPTWQRYLAKLVHFLLYVLILVMPLSGWFMSSAAGYPPSFWGWFTVAAPIAPSKAVAGLFDQIHNISAWILGGLILIHFLGALKHTIIDKDGVLKKMF